jgi:protein-tyrosine phosphatase
LDDEAMIARSIGDTPFWLPLRNGALAISHRPKKAALDALRRSGCTHILTLLSEREGAEEIGAAVRGAGLDWLWLPLENAQPPAAARDAEMLTAFAQIAAVLDTGGRILIHCSAGIHRPGMIAYAFLRFMGASSADSRQQLYQLRTVTAEGAGEERLAWGDRFAGP